ncbi:hypothetical protein ACIBEJ_51250 [Nonomuraea sp. NPDC050790]|uniref:hypothetical protein n=1 Tax=Nonomuraea sp. NPDC050790 TaxID=3364371 RepID=UPI0037BC8B0F
MESEWTRFRKRRWLVAGMVVAALVPVLVGIMIAATSRATCGNQAGEEPCPGPVLGPGGLAVEDKFYFVHQSLRGDGSITARVSSMTGRIKEPPPPGTGGGPPPVPGLVPWAKAGLMVKDGVRRGSRYAAIMVTAEHGVRMQHDFTEDVAGSSGAFPRWLRLTRTGDTLVGHESADGKAWTEVGRAELKGLPGTVEIGLFAASPGALTMAGGGPESRFSEATAVFDKVSPKDGTWRTDDIGVTMEPDGVTPHHPGAFSRSGDTFTVTGVGDIAPSSDLQPVERTLIGAYAGLILVVIVAVAFVTADPGRLWPKAGVVGVLGFVAGVVPAAVVVPVSLWMLPANGIHPLPAEPLTYARVIVGTGLLSAAVAVLSLGVGALLRRTAVAVVAVLSLVFLPYALALAGVGEWLLAVTPAAGFAIQQSARRYDQVDGFYTAMTGYFPLAPWAGFAVLCAYAALGLALAKRRLP